MSYSFLDNLTASTDGTPENLPRQAVDDALTIFAPRYREAVRELLGRPLRRPSPTHNGDILNSVDIRLSNDYPPAWSFLRHRYGQLDPYNTFRLWRELRTTSNAAQYLLEHQQALNEVLDQLQYIREEPYADRPPRRRPVRAWPQTLIATQAQVTGLLEELQELYDDIRRALYETGTDVLGTYELLSNPEAADFQPAHGQIVLYWKPIVMAAFDLDLEIRDVARVTLLHTLIHAYGNLGMDTDGHRWLTFVHSEPAVVEAVAEFYSYQYIRRSEDRSLRRTYAELLRGVPANSPYLHHLSWLEQGVKNEQVRRALQRATANGAKELTAFEKLLFS